MFRLLAAARWGLACCVTIAFIPTAFGQAPAVKPPAFFGAPDGAFNEKTLALPKPKTPEAAVVPFEGAIITKPPPPPKYWSGGVDLGLNGATGNSELFNLLAGFTANRKSSGNLFSSSLVYSYAKQNGAVTQQQALFNARDEILFPGSPWTLFTSTNAEYDEFKNYDFVFGQYAGVGYAIVDNDTLNWRIRAGAGASKQFGGPQNNWVPEGIFGTDFSYKFNDRQSFVASGDYYPNLQRFSQYRVRARAAYQIVLDPQTCTTLRLGVQDRYDSNSGNSQPNDFNYFAALGFTF